MPNPKYVAGVAFELKVQLVLETQGYTVTRSAGSKGEVDLVAVNRAYCLHIQCKRRGGGIAWVANRLLAISPNKPDTCRAAVACLNENGGLRIWWRLPDGIGMLYDTAGRGKPRKPMMTARRDKCRSNHKSGRSESKPM